MQIERAMSFPLVLGLTEQAKRQGKIFLKSLLSKTDGYDRIATVAMIEQTYPGVAQLVARLTGGQEAVSSSLATRTISSVHNGFKLWTLDFSLYQSVFPLYRAGICSVLLFYANLEIYHPV